MVVYCMSPASRATRAQRPLAARCSQLVLLDGNYVVDQGITAPTGTTLTLNGVWTNESTISADRLDIESLRPWTNAVGATISAQVSTLSLGDQDPLD